MEGRHSFTQEDCGRGGGGWVGRVWGSGVGSDNMERVKVCKLLLVSSETKQIYTAVWDDSIV